jgi:hypothetical protein
MFGRNEPVPLNPPHLVAPTRVKVLRAFCIKGKRVEPGSTVTIQFHLAKELEAIGKVELVRDNT